MRKPAVLVQVCVVNATRVRSMGIGPFGRGIESVGLGEDWGVPLSMSLCPELLANKYVDFWLIRDKDSKGLARSGWNVISSELESTVLNRVTESGLSRQFRV